MPEQIAKSILPLSQALEAQIASSKSATNKLGNLAKKSVAQEAKIAKELTTQASSMKTLESEVTRILRKAAEDQKILQQELYSTREALQNAKKTPILALLVSAAVPTLAVLWMAREVGLMPF
jgi:uncharacterized protein involved in exopolysaccharide biosynthesis